jgi:thiaminase (transcriptional activator TenA)
MSLSARLWADNADLAAAALDHPFVRGLADGSLTEASFRYYVGQDAFFLEAFARAYGLALANSRDRGELLAFADLLLGVLDELRLHDAYAARWGVDLSAVEPGEATEAYTDFLLDVGESANVATLCAAMVPCMRLYAHLGQSLAGAGGPYAEWVATYADPGFAALAERLEGLLDARGGHGRHLEWTYRKAMSLEVAFFDAALAGT